MKDDSRYIVGGAALGAVAGALGGWLLLRLGPKKKNGGPISSRSGRKLDGRKLIGLGGGVIGVIRQILDLI